MLRPFVFLSSRCLAVVVALLLFGPTVGCEFSCGRSGHEKRLEKSIAKHLAKQLDRKVTKVKCPGDIDAKEGDVTMCTAIFPDGEKLPIEVLWTDDVGGFSWKAKPEAKPGVDLVRALEKSIAKELARQGKAEVESVKCPDGQTKEGSVIICTATLPDGTTLPIEVLWTDNVGGFSWRAKPGVDAKMKDFGQLVAEALAAQYETEFSGATCPSDVEMKKGVVFECVATIAGGSQLPVKVTWTNDKGGYLIADKGIVSLDKLELVLGKELSERKSPGKVDCHGKIRASEPGSSFICDIAFADGKSGKVKILVKDWTGNVNWEYQ